MRELQIGNQQVRVRATPLALLFYKQEFKSDLLGDMVKFEAVATDITKIDTVVILQIIWAMAKADVGVSGKFPSFVEWAGELDSFDVSDKDLIRSAMDEAADGFFRSGASGRKAPGEKTGK